jgi:hypothetical protein
MSRDDRKPQREVSRDTVRTSAIAPAKLSGCVCNPEVRITRFLGIPLASIARDTWCPLVGGKGH